MNPVERPWRIEFLYWEGCPSYKEALRTLNAVLAEEGIVAEVELRRVETDAEAEELRFPGSPTIRIDGRDIEESQVLPVGLACRVYRVGEEISGVPSRTLLLSALRRT